MPNRFHFHFHFTFHEREIFEDQQEITTLTEIWARQLVRLLALSRRLGHAWVGPRRASDRTFDEAVKVSFF